MIASEADGDGANADGAHAGESCADGAIVDVRGLKKRYDRWSVRRRRSVDALRGVSLSARPGEVFGLLGPNGAGKTTLIKILLGVVKPSGGEAYLFGQPVGSLAARRRVGYLPESLRVDRHHTARSALKYYGRLSGMHGRQIRRRSDELLELVGLQGRDRESVRRFSKGMYQRLGLAQALMHDPDLLVLDEPTDGLDPVGRNEVRKVIERLRDSGKTIFLNSHILQEVELVCTRVAILAKGKICGTGLIDELSHPDDVQQVRIEIIVPDDAVESGADASDAIKRVIEDCFAGLANDSPSDHSVAQQVEYYRIEDHRFRLHAPLIDQHQVDAVIDRLRQKQISIVRLDAHRPTLEDTFMKLVQDAEESA